ncbi:hypothetical protein SAMN05444161_5735 [Rhizobiales bacterium GAS191]|jgi:hypothetical protein|nr:hypothetical protein SAMN05519103_04927 [Rhizobiales bacterium GAS113]SEE14210.1 hypothetical protein SAMN05519104_5313 [Rhizobiales bacterium GAS188]SEE43003.1 hypothetical protein SAMN05444161_5735 [Rhizobiales bacterium GAS191]
MKLNVILPAIASLALGVVSPAFAQTNPQPTAQQPIIQDQGDPTTPARAAKVKGQKMAKGTTGVVKTKHAKAKAMTPAPVGNQAAPAAQD